MMERIQIGAGMAIKLELIGKLSVEPKWKGEQHKHHFRELIYASKGCVEICVSLNSRTERIRLAEGRMLLIPPDMGHHVVNFSDTEAMIVYIGYSSDDPLPSRTPLMLTDDMEEDLRPLLEGFTGRADMFTVQAALISKLALLSEKLNKNCTFVQCEKNSQELLAGKVKSYIRKNYNRGITVSEIAGAIYLTPHYLGMVFRSVTGMTIHEYLLDVRMQKAVELMRSRSMSLAEISERLGFDTPQYFSSCFKRFYLLSPSEFRKRM